MDYPYKGTFSTMEEVEAYLSQERLTCLICGKEFHQLSLHLIHTHKISIDEYKKRYGLPWTRGLVSPTVREKCCNLMLEKKAKGLIAQQPCYGAY